MDRTPIETDTGIYGFFGKYRFLSNYHLVDIKMDDGLSYPSSENAYMAHKSLNMETRKLFTNIQPKDAKQLGQTIGLRENWDQIKLEVMESILRAKFNHWLLKDLLLQTGEKYLEETNDWNDRYWGVCEGVGENHLGKIIMKIRSDLK